MIWKCEFYDDESAELASVALDKVKNTRLGSALIVLISESWMVNYAVNKMFDLGFYTSNNEISDYDIEKLNGAQMKTVALIVGHSEISGGAINKSTGINEFDFNEPLALIIAEKLRENDFLPFVIYRTGSYSELPTKVNLTGVDIAISLHCNAFNKKKNGTETLYYVKSKNGKRLAGLLQNEIVKCLGLRDRGIKARQEKHKGGPLLKYTNMPCALTEAFFIDCDESLELARFKLDELAGAYVNAVKRYFELSIQ